MSAHSATILHLSDLHLGQNLEDTGRSEKATVRSYLKKGWVEMQTHHPYILAVLPLALREAARAIGAKDDRFDFHVITGDISAAANSEERFRFARQFLLGRVAWRPGFDTGLNLPEEKLLCVPGNHDKMMELTPVRYLSAFQNLQAPPHYVFEGFAQNGRRFIFYAMDSNLYGEGNIAVGRVDPPTLAWFGERMADVESDDEKKSDAVRVLLLHHHPCNLNRFRRLSFTSALWNRFTRLEEADRLLELCRGRIDIIMHGHEHFPIAFKDDQSGCLVVSAGTTSQFQVRGGVNSFHVLVLSGTEVRVVQLDCHRARFRREKEWNFDLSSREFSLVWRRKPWYVLEAAGSKWPISIRKQVAR